MTDGGINGDLTACRQIFTNLVSNAVKFSPAGGTVFLGAHRSPDGFMRLSVQDEGPGISVEDQKKLFKPFTRLSNKTASLEHSVGLGLSIVKLMAEGMGGIVRCESTPDQGSTFSVFLPGAGIVTRLVRPDIPAKVLFVPSVEPRSWEEIRRDFPILDQQVNGHPLIYLDNAATSQKPSAVLDCLNHYYEHDNSNVHRGLHELSNRATASYENARIRLAGYIGAQPEEIVFTRGTTEAINLVAYTWGEKHIGPGDIILLTEMEHHSNLVPWQLLALPSRGQPAVCPCHAEGMLDLSQLDALLSGPVKLFAFTRISNSLGTINPVAGLCAQARQAGVTTLVDAAQSAGHRSLDVREIGCDFLALSGHKMWDRPAAECFSAGRNFWTRCLPFTAEAR